MKGEYIVVLVLRDKAFTVPQVYVYGKCCVRKVLLERKWRIQTFKLYYSFISLEYLIRYDSGIIFEKCLLQKPGNAEPKSHICK
jgi:hypothetical protein